MASIPAQESDIGIGNGTTWGTARDLSGANIGRLLYATTFDPSVNFGEYRMRDIGADNFLTAARRLAQTVDISTSGDLLFDGSWIQIAAQILGTAGTPSETTVGQGDYLHNLDVASSITGKFLTMSYKVEDDYVLEFPSVKFYSLTLRSPVNDVGTWSAQGIASGVTDHAGAVNNIAKLNALTYPTHAPAVFGGTNMYLRMNNASAGALSSSNDLPISDWELTISRPLQRRYVSRGASSIYTLEPHQQGLIECTLSFGLTQIDDSVVNGIVEFLAQTEKKVEIFFDGTQIGTGVNRSIKLQMPRLIPAPAMPSGYNIPNNNSLMQPRYSYTALQATAAPTGMSGVTNLLRMAVIGTRVQNWLN